MNHRIRAPEVLVIGHEGAKLGIFPVKEAVRMAEEQGMDLVEVQANAKPPVCKIIDYGKFKYEEKKKAHVAKKKQVVVVVKEIKMRPKTDTHDFDFKANHAHRFLEEGDKVKAVVVFRGREIAHQEIGLEHLNRMAERVKDVGVVESAPRLDGKAMVMILAPKNPPRADAPPRPTSSAPIPGLDLDD